MGLPTPTTSLAHGRLDPALGVDGPRRGAFHPSSTERFTTEDGQVFTGFFDVTVTQQDKGN
jgi:hypothetical protein